MAVTLSSFVKRAGPSQILSRNWLGVAGARAHRAAGTGDSVFRAVQFQKLCRSGGRGVPEPLETRARYKKMELCGLANGMLEVEPSDRGAASR